MFVSEIVFRPKNRFFGGFALASPPPRVSTHQVGSLPAPQNEKAEADVPKSGGLISLWNKIPSELPTGFFKPENNSSPALDQPLDGTTAQTRT